ncbi:UPF0755 protein [Jatrophihabitans endophyticus]|uniref:Endolytic murein transglycosylase n=1 Tax=Jatrophihabitans endophyticus TaxID=1206085 RepID=A0A1M5LLF9_9ACTN|nr:endolytic transglycosylase MltG [Jatrophihabitans endophyticus]SHG65972.1 UPF0755 protein [Jatrophihabitans endophyticus]
MARRDRESVYDSDTHDLLFGPGADRDEFDDQDPHDGGHDDDSHDDEIGDAGHHRPTPRAAHRPGSRSARRSADRDRRRRRAIAVLATLLVLVLAAGVYFVALPIYHYLSPDDYDGAGSGSVVVTVHANDGSSQIGQTLEKAGVVGSERAFADAAEDDDRAQNIQPGSYRLRRHMSADSALALLLDPASKVSSGTVVTEGATVVDVEKRLVAKACAAGGAAASGCGPGMSAAAVTKALTDVKALGIPTDYLPKGKDPASVEGFLFPATYTFDEETQPTEALQQMVGKFTDVVRSSGFSAKAKELGLSPYQALIVASIAQAEAKFAEDFPRVARVILNRIAADRPLQVDATSAYAAKLKGLDPTEEIYAQTQGPFNTYRNAGLPPTPIGNPGSEALAGAVAPAAGKWLFYVNKDAAGHLGFYDDEKSFTRAQQKCHDAGWGCAAP